MESEKGEKIVASFNNKPLTWLYKKDLDFTWNSKNSSWENVSSFCSKFDKGLHFWIYNSNFLIVDFSLGKLFNLVWNDAKSCSPFNIWTHFLTNSISIELYSLIIIILILEILTSQCGNDLLEKLANKNVNEKNLSDYSKQFCENLSLPNDIHIFAIMN